MFNFFKNRQQKKEAELARSRAFEEVLAQMSKGQANRLEVALVLHLTEENQESQARFLMELGASDLWVLNSKEGRFGDPAVTQGEDHSPYIAAFTSRERAAAAAVEWELPNQPSPISALELVFVLNARTGIMINAHEPHLRWVFTPQQVANLGTLYESSFRYEPGGIFSIWSGEAYQAAKLLQADDHGVHLRLYGNHWSERPASIDPAELTLGSTREGTRSIGHLPVVKSSFLSMGPTRAAHAPVTGEELEGYKIWEEAKGGYFGS